MRTAAEGLIPWKGLKHEGGCLLDACPAAAAEGLIPWKGLKRHHGHRLYLHHWLAAEGLIPWKGLKPYLAETRYSIAGAAEGLIPWKGLKPLFAHGGSGQISAAEGLIPWKGLKQLAHFLARYASACRRRADSLEGIETLKESSAGISADRLYGFERFNLQNLISLSGMWRVECPGHIHDLRRLP